MVEGVKHDAGKVDYTLVPVEALEVVCRVLEFGAKKYARDNWRTVVAKDSSRYLKALLRHAFAVVRGEWLDPESGFPHLAHVACCALFLLANDAAVAKETA